MKKIILGSIVLCLFSLSIILMQIGCKKDAIAQTNNYILPKATTTTLGGVIVGAGLQIDNAGILSSASQTNNYVLPKATSTTLGGIIAGSGLEVNVDGVLSLKANGNSISQLGKMLFSEVSNNGGEQKLYTSNYDGSGKTLIPISLPSGREFRSIPVHAVLSPDGKVIFFEVWETSTSTYFIYSCLVDGTALKVIHTSSNQTQLSLSGVY